MHPIKLEVPSRFRSFWTHTERLSMKAVDNGVRLRFLESSGGEIESRLFGMAQTIDRGLRELRLFHRGIDFVP